MDVVNQEGRTKLQDATKSSLAERGSGAWLEELVSKRRDSVLRLDGRESVMFTVEGGKLR